MTSGNPTDSRNNIKEEMETEKQLLENQTQKT